MKLVQLENFVSNFDNIVQTSYWQEFGTFISYDRTKQEEVIERCADADALLINKTGFGEKEFSQLPKLKYIGILATGYNVVDLESARKHGVTVTNVPAYSTESVAQLAFAHILNFAREVGLYAHEDWSSHIDYTFCISPQFELNGRTLGIIGFGSIGHSVARIANAFGMNVLVHTRTPGKVDVPYAEYVSLEELLKRSDFVTLHCPLTAQNGKMINRETIAMMKDGAYLINTARGGLVDEDALLEGLNSGKLAGAGLDVLNQEPPSPDNPLLRCPKCRITPHIAWSTHEARMRLFQIARENLRAWVAGKRVNVVN